MKNVQVLLFCFLAILCHFHPAARAQDQNTVVIAAIGDSLTAGYGLASDQAFPVRLEAALKKRGHKVRVINAGVSGDTATGGLSRLSWSLPAETGAVILELGSNDALRGVDPGQTLAALGGILKLLDKRKTPVLLAGMLAPPNMGPAYGRAFNAIYPSLAEKYPVIFYPFFLKGVAARPELNQADGIHPNPRGVKIIVENILPFVEKLLFKVKKQP